MDFNKEMANLIESIGEVNIDKLINRIVVPSGGSAHVIIPKKWIGSSVAVVRLED